MKKTVDGFSKGNIFLYALSTCVWCKKTKKLLNNLGVKYSYIDVDLIEDNLLEDILNKIRHYNPRCSFPTLIINDKCVLGYKEAEIRELLK